MGQDQLSWVVETPGNKQRNEVSLYAENGVRSRRYHHKSRNGCYACKRRRVKCDEGKPGCGQCADRRAECAYPEKPAQASASPASSTSAASDNSHRITSDPAIAEAVMSILEASNAPCTTREKGGTYQRSHALDVIDHFAGCTEPWLGSPLCQQIMQQHAVRLSLNAPYLLHAVLAISAAHLFTLNPSEKKFWIASTLHYHLSLGLYSAAITHNLQDTDADAIFAASILHAMLAFFKLPNASEKLALDLGTSPSWIVSWQGVKTLVHTPVLRTRLRCGVWLPLIQVYETWENARVPLDDDDDDDDNDNNDNTKNTTIESANQRVGACTLRALKELCEEDGVLEYEEVEEQSARLNVLFRLDAASDSGGGGGSVDDDNIDGFVAFLAGVPTSCVSRLRLENESALLVLAYWCAMFGRYEQWWIATPAKIECAQLCAHLRHSTDVRVRALLRIPARLCGYALGADL